MKLVHLVVDSDPHPSLCFLVYHEMVVIPFEVQLDAPLKVRVLNDLHHGVPIVWLVFLDVVTFVEFSEVGDDAYFSGVLRDASESWYPILCSLALLVCQLSDRSSLRFFSNSCHH